MCNRFQIKGGEMINKRIKLLTFVLAIALCFLVGCKPKPISIEVSTNPTKLVYF